MWTEWTGRVTRSEKRQVRKIVHERMILYWRHGLELRRRGS